MVIYNFKQGGSNPRTARFTPSRAFAFVLCDPNWATFDRSSEGQSECRQMQQPRGNSTAAC